MLELQHLAILVPSFDNPSLLGRWVRRLRSNSMVLLSQFSKLVAFIILCKAGGHCGAVDSDLRDTRP